MKTFLIYLLCIMFSIAAFAQNKEVGEIEVTAPSFAGINDLTNRIKVENKASITEFLKQNLVFPEEAIKNCCEGTEVIRFEVTPNGELTNFSVVNSVSPEIDQALIALLKTTNGMWIPGKNNGEPVTMEKEVSVKYKWGEFECFALCKDFEEMGKLYLEKGNKQLLTKNNPEKALKFYNRGIKYLPDEDCLLMSRGICRYELGDTEGAYKDWDRMSIEGVKAEAIRMAENFILRKGYADLAFLLDN